MTLRVLVCTAIASLFALPISARAQFDGELVLLPVGCQAAGQCTLKNKLRFADPTGAVWEAKAGLVTDGASIPGIFQPFVGKPFEEDFIKAAVIHDHYCDRHVRPWRQTHRVFYEGLVAQGVSKAKAKVMYFAVYLGGPKWVELIPGLKCDGNCINAMKTSSGSPGFRARKADYAAQDLPEELRKLSEEIEANPDLLTLDEIDARARALRPNDYYYKNGSRVKVDNPLAIE